MISKYQCVNTSDVSDVWYSVARFLLCDRPELGRAPQSSPLSKPTPAKKSALDASVNASQDTVQVSCHYSIAPRNDNHRRGGIVFVRTAAAVFRQKTLFGKTDKMLAAKTHLFTQTHSFKPPNDQRPLYCSQIPHCANSSDPSRSATPEPAVVGV